MNFRLESFMLRAPDEAEGWSGDSASVYQQSVADSLKEVVVAVIQPAQEVNQQVDNVTGK